MALAHSPVVPVRNKFLTTLFLALFLPFLAGAADPGSLVCPFDIHSGDVTATTAFVQASLLHPSCRSPHSYSSSSSQVVFHLSRTRNVPQVTSSSRSTMLTRTISVFPHGGIDPRLHPGGYVAKLRLRGLLPDTKYYYRFVTLYNQSSPLSSFNTLPLASSEKKTTVRFNVFTAFNQPPFNVLRHSMANRPHFAILAGDTVSAVKEWLHSASLSSSSSDAPPPATHAYYRKLYTSEQRNETYVGGPWLSDMLRMLPSFAVWDDGDMYPDMAGTNGFPRVVHERQQEKKESTNNGPDGLPPPED